MARLTDPVRLEHYRHVLKSWSVSCCINFTQVAAEWMLKELGCTQRQFKQKMWEFVVMEEGEIDEVKERRPEYSEHEFHHDLRFKVDGRLVYVETRLLQERDINDSEILVVNIHDR